MDHYSTHQEVLVNVLCRTVGPVLELGSGDYSTPILSAICRLQERRLMTLDSDSAWLARFRYLERPGHDLQTVSDWDLCPAIDWKWGLVFVDHAPAERRIIELTRIRDRADFIVVHDTEDPRYGYEQVFPLFEHIKTSKRHPVWTSVLSNRHPIFDLP